MNIETMSNFFKVPKEVDTTTYKPIIKEWEIYFEEFNGWNNRDVVAKVFARFLEDFTARKLEIPGKCMLGGKVFGHKKFNDGDEIFTSDIKSAEKIKSCNHDGVRQLLICVTTVSGGRYYFYSRDYNPYMFLMLGDLEGEGGRLDVHRYYYLKPEFRGSKLI